MSKKELRKQIINLTGQQGDPEITENGLLYNIELDNNSYVVEYEFLEGFNPNINPDLGDACNWDNPINITKL
ncbi:MAG: hypothetical protein ACOCRK_07410 [bacterium]